MLRSTPTSSSANNFIMSVISAIWPCCRQYAARLRHFAARLLHDGIVAVFQRRALAAARHDENQLQNQPPPARWRRQTTPMTYEVNGRQFVVIASGGHAWYDTPMGDYVVAFALPE